jgi:hypothetical protein
MAETLTEEQVLDLIAVGEKKPKAKDPSKPDGDGDHDARAAEASLAPGGEREPQDDGRTAAAEPAWEPAPEHRCLVEPLAALSLFTGISLPIGTVEWVADEADNAGLVDYDHVDLTHAADALVELRAHLDEERRGAAAMGDPIPKIRGRAALRALILSYLKGKRTWLDLHGDVYRARDEARSREQAHEASLTPEQRERRGLPALGRADGGRPDDPGETPCFSPVPEPPQPREPAPAPDPRENRVRSRIAMIDVALLSEASSSRRADLEDERADLQQQLAELLERGPPE